MSEHAPTTTFPQQSPHEQVSLSPIVSTLGTFPMCESIATLSTEAAQCLQSHSAIPLRHFSMDSVCPDLCYSHSPTQPHVVCLSLTRVLEAALPHFLLTCCTLQATGPTAIAIVQVSVGLHLFDIVYGAPSVCQHNWRLQLRVRHTCAAFIL